MSSRIYKNNKLSQAFIHSHDDDDDNTHTVPQYVGITFNNNQHKYARNSDFVKRAFSFIPKQCVLGYK